MKMDIKYSSLLILLLLGSCNTFAQVLTLEKVLSAIEEQNPMLREYDSRVKAYNEYSAGASGWMAPMIGAGTFMTPYKPDEAMHENEKGAWMFSLEQEIPNPAKQNANKKYLQSRGNVEKENREVQFNNLRSEAKTNYYEWLVAEKKLSVLNTNAEVMNVMLRLAKIRYPYNQGNLGNIYKAEGRLAEIRNTILMVKSDIENNRYRLKALMAIPLSDSIMIDTTTRVTFSPVQIADDTTALQSHRSDIRRIDETIEVMRLNQQLQKFQAKPDFKLRFDHMQPIGDMPRQFSAMAMVSIPIAPWSSKMYKSEVKGMHYEIDAMQKARAAILIETKGMLAGMALRITRMQQQLRNYETKIIPALQKNHETLMLAYEENMEELPMVIDAWEALNMAQLEYLDKLNEYYLMIVSYEKEIEK